MKIRLDGYIFDSQPEARRYTQLKFAQHEGKLNNLIVHPTLELLASFEHQGEVVRGINYRPDFMYSKGKQIIVEEVKAYKTEGFWIKEKLFKKRYPHYVLRMIKPKDIE